VIRVDVNERQRRTVALVAALLPAVWSNWARAEPTAADPSAALPPAEAAPRAEAEPETGEFARGVRIGAIGGVGFPRPLAVEAMIKLDRLAAFGAEYASLPATTIDGVQTSLWSLAADARVFPFRGAFFVGIRAGRQHVDASTPIAIAPFGSFGETLAIDSWFVNPRVGFLWTWSTGFTLGMEAGLQIPLGVAISSTFPLALDPQAKTTIDTLGNTVLPTVDLIRIGLLL
jgi:hypothetical protein